MALADTAELIVALKLRDQVSGGLSRLNSQLKGMGGGLSQIGTGLGQVGRGVDQIVTRGAIAATAGLTGVITTAASFEQAWAGVQKTVEGANDALLNDFKQLSREIPLSFEELAGIGAEGGALGIATKDLINFTDIVARLAVSTDLSAEQASSALGQLANVLHLEDADLRDFGDSLVALGNDGASTESQILDLTARFGAAGHQAGLSNEEILALSSTVASMGIEAEAGGGALSRVFNNMTLDIASANDESKVLADAMGLSLGELRTAWDHDAGQVFEDLLGYISKLDQFEAASFLSDLGITNTRDINAITLLASGVDEYQRQLGVAEGQTDELNRESDAFFNTTEGKWELLKNNVRLAADSIGSQLLPVVNDLIEDFTGWLSDPATQRGIESFATNLADGIKDLVREIKNADFGPLIDTMKGAAAVAAGAFDLFRKLPPAVQQLALAAIVANKVSGGAVGSIAKGLGNILSGSIKLLFGRGETPLRPLFVKEVGLGGGIGGGAGGLAGGKGGGLRGGLGTALKIAVPALIAAEIADTLEEPLEELAGDLHHQLGLDQDWNPLRNLSPDDLQWPFGPKNTPTILPEIFGGNGVLGGTGATGGRARSGNFLPSAPHPDPRGRSPEARAIEEALSADRVLLQKIVDKSLPDTALPLPDTALDPVVTALEPIAANTRTIIDGTDSDRVLLQNVARLTEANNEQVRVASEAKSADQVMLETARRATAENVGRLDALRGNFVEAIRLDTSMVTDLRKQTSIAFAAQQADAAMLATARLQTTKLDTANSRLGTIAAKNFNPTIVFNPKLSTTVIQYQSGRAAALSGTQTRTFIP